MSERPEKPSFSGARVLKASRVLSAGQKLVWLEDYALDQGPEGSWITSTQLAARLGMTPRTVETYRGELKAMGLYATVSRAGGTRSWYPTLPAEVVPRTARPTPEDISTGVMLFDDHLRYHDPGRGRTTTGVVVAPRQGSGSQPDASRGTSLREGGRGVGSNLPFDARASLQPPAVEADGAGPDGPKAEDGEGAPRPESWSATDREKFERDLARLPAEKAAKLRRIAYGL